MPNPIGASYAVESGGDLYAGCFPPTSAWYEAIGPLQWGELPNSTLSTSGVGWAGTHPGGTGNYSAIVTAWGGGILNTVGLYIDGVFIAGTFLVIWGGGHGDYGGNELYAYGPLEDDAPAWHRLLDPSIPAPDDVARLSGKPVSRHTYDTLVYLPDQNKMLCIGAPGYYHTGSAYNVSDLFDFNVNPLTTNPWSTNDAGFPAYNGGGAGTIGLFSAYNPTTKKAWGVGCANGNKIGSYDTVTGAWTTATKNNGFQSSSGPYTKGAIDPRNNLLAFIDQTATVRVQDLDDPWGDLFTPTVAGAGPTAGNQVLEWDEDGERFVAWGRSGKKLYFLTPGANPMAGGDAWTWSSAAPSTGATPAAETPNGTFGRFRVKSGHMRGVVLMPAADKPICFYRM